MFRFKNILVRFVIYHPRYWFIVHLVTLLLYLGSLIFKVQAVHFHRVTLLVLIILP